MAKQCAICEKSSRMVGHYNKLRGKYNPTPKTRKYPNLQWVLIPVGTGKKDLKEFSGKRVMACTKCIKSMGCQK